MRLIVTLFVLLFTQLFFNLAHAAPQSRVAAEPRKSHVSDARPDERRKKKTLKSSKKARTATAPKTTKVKAHKSTTIKTAKKTTRIKSTRKVTHLAKNKVTPPKKGYKKGYGRHRTHGLATSKLLSDDKPLKLSAAHKKRYQRAKQTAMTKLMNQMGKPYRWGGASPRTGFDCSGLIYYAYKDVMKIKMPRTANEMYHLRDAAPIKKSELQKGDLVFFRINNRGVADHVGVYLGDGKFIQSPRTGKDIRISQLDNNYWQNHYIGARRVMTPKTVR
ncbi:C40 family peptidase [Serratia rhizosphaerae]|uniref:NlpC/P60 family protein n=1 Tax=Serratia rhizosphaerae TaxID=2597702 RepID=A0ABX6GTQ0_9GAMM|nr:MULTISPECIES: C40 family peptidase [Serratia]MBU3892239.1 C40 family peptidase [Serratia rubidaea]AVJ17575.1 hydrolase [Serratia sp. MYb239]MCA4822089.1 C40 family peptidase [Serratia rubidaea]MEB6336782.1 C40 family peptidase [Serratia rhizosphaerae]QHA89658.1 NlpC/P60 family protein [Serratia rhizosphaerae]